MYGMKKQYISPRVSVITLEHTLPVCSSLQGKCALSLGVETNEELAPDAAEVSSYRSTLWE